MEIKNRQAAILSNYEVMNLLNEKKSCGGSAAAVHQEASQLATVMYETSHYLQELSCCEQSSEKIDRLLTLLENFPVSLTKLEKLMICNNPPTSVLQLSLIIKDCEEKLSEEDIEEWLRKINDVLIHPVISDSE